MEFDESNIWKFWNGTFEHETKIIVTQQRRKINSKFTYCPICTGRVKILYIRESTQNGNGINKPVGLFVCKTCNEVIKR